MAFIQIHLKHQTTPTHGSTSEEIISSTSSQSFSIAFQQDDHSTSKKIFYASEEVRPFDKMKP